MSWGRAGLYRRDASPVPPQRAPGEAVSELDRRLAQVAERQHCLITTADVRAAGGGHTHVEARVRGGRWEKVERNVFRITGTPVTPAARLLAVVLAAGPGAVGSHFSAAAMWGIPGFSLNSLEVSIPRGRRYRRQRVRSHESSDLDRCRVVTRDGVPVTDVARTLLDLGRYVGPSRLLRSVEWCRRNGLVDWPELIATLRRHARQGRPGVRRLRGVILANAHRSEVTDSDFELLVIASLLEGGLPEPVLHHRVLDGERFVAEVDLAYPALKIAIELDGRHHLKPEVRERDLARQNDLVLLGWTVLRFSWERFAAHPERVLSEVRAAIQGARG